MSTSTLTSKGRVTIPKEIRERLGLKEGDRLFKFDERGNLLVRPESKDPLGRLPGRPSSRVERPVTIEEMQEAIEERSRGAVQEGRPALISQDKLKHPSPAPKIPPKSVPAGSVPKALPPLPPKRLAQKASATGVGVG